MGGLIFTGEVSAKCCFFSGNVLALSSKKFSGEDTVIFHGEMSCGISGVRVPAHVG